MAFCSGCGTQIADGTTMCPACSSRTAAPAAAAQGTTGGMQDNVVGMLAYITIIPAIIFLVVEPFSKNKFSCGRRPDTANIFPTAEFDVPTPPDRSEL